MAKMLPARIMMIVGDALLERDRLEIRAMDALLSRIERPLRRAQSRPSTSTKRQPNKKRSQQRTSGARRRHLR